MLQALYLFFAVCSPDHCVQSFSKAAGTVAMGVAATAMLSALAIDVTDAALLGAVAMGSIAAMSTPSSGGTSGGTNGGTSRKAGSSRTRTAATCGGEPGLSEEGAAAEAAAGDASEAASGQRSSDTIGSKASAPGEVAAQGRIKRVRCFVVHAWQSALPAPQYCLPAHFCAACLPACPPAHFPVQASFWLPAC